MMLEFNVQYTVKTNIYVSNVITMETLTNRFVVNVPQNPLTFFSVNKPSQQCRSTSVAIVTVHTYTAYIAAVVLIVHPHIFMPLKHPQTAAQSFSVCYYLFLL